MELLDLKQRVNSILYSPGNSKQIMQKVCKLLYDEVEHYHWVGFYLNHPIKASLELETYAGADTDHTSIPHGKGICGQVALSNQTFVVQDVQEQDNYLACSVETKSEIVVPIIKNGKNIGQIDVDSHDLAPFTKADENLLTYVCQEIAHLL